MNNPMHADSISENGMEFIHSNGECQVDILQLISDAVIATNPDLIITSWNKGAEVMYGWKAEEVVGKRTIAILNTELTTEEIELALLEVKIKGSYRCEVIQSTKSQQKLAVNVNATGLFNMAGRFTGLISVNRDISSQKQAKQKLLTSNIDLEQTVAERTEQLELVNKELEGFSYSISHDLQAPLRIIDGYSQILIEDYSTILNEEGKKTIEVIRKNTKRMKQLIDDLLQFASLGKQNIGRSTVNMEKTVIDCLEELKEGGTIIPEQLTIKDLLPVQADGNLIKQVWINLISNAAKYSSKALKPKIEIGMIREAGNNVYYIKDNGAGFNMKYYHKLFGVFQRLHHQDEFNGTGVGLALVKRILQKHGGSIWAEAKPNEGATFYYSLPCTRSLV